MDMMTLCTALSRSWANHFVALIFDNEVTVGEFVTNPPLPWARLIQRDGTFEIAEGYPTLLTAEQAEFEMTNWDQVSLTGCRHLLRDVEDFADLVIFGNNAGQSVPLAQHLPPRMVAERSAIIYARALPEIDVYERLGYRRFLRRDETIPYLKHRAEQEERPLALCFVNTIQHNESNYHTP